MQEQIGNKCGIVETLKNQKEMLEIKNMLTKIKNATNGPFNRLIMLKKKSLSLNIDQ